MKYFLDTEFNDNVTVTELISVGIVADDDREFYAINKEYGGGGPKNPKVLSCNDWVKRNVIPILADTVDLDMSATALVLGDPTAIRNGMQDFVGNDPFPEFWAYYGHYDWVLVTKLWKSLTSLPKNWPTACYDVHQFAKHAGRHRTLPKKLEPEHHALVDARWTKLAFQHVLDGDLTNAPRERKWP